MSRKRLLSKKIRSKMKRNKMSFASKSSRVGYLRLLNSGQERITRNIRLLDILKYEGPDIYLDFSDSNRLIGIEILDI